MLRFASILLFLSLAASVAAADTIEPYRSLCMIRTMAGQGSGTLIAKAENGCGLVLTCRHVAQQVGQRVLVSFIWSGGGETSPGVVLQTIKGRDFDTDLAVVLVDRVPNAIRPRLVVKFDYRKGPWIGAGYRAGELRVTHPVTEALIHPNGLVIVPTPFVGGMSGGALFDKHGNVVAVVVASDMVTTGVAADGELLHQMVRQFLKQ